MICFARLEKHIFIFSDYKLSKKMNSVGSIVNTVMRVQLQKSVFKTISKNSSSLTYSELIHKQNELFNMEKNRQKANIGRIEKIDVQIDGLTESTTLTMNKHISTPFNCAQHLNEMLTKRTAVALLNGTTLWHMHRPLIDNCTVEFLHYKIQQPAAVNKAFWRTCSFLLGAVATNAFKDNIEVQLHSFPSPNVKSGSFIHDVQLSLNDWTPTEEELRVLSIEMVKFCQQNHPIECMDVDTDFALLLFEKNPHKTKQIPNIALNNNGRVTLFKAGHYIDISKGPMVTNTSHIGRITITAVHKLQADLPGYPLYRFQGVALPSSVILNHFAYGVIEDRGKKLNNAKIPGTSYHQEEISIDQTQLLQ